MGRSRVMQLKAGWFALLAFLIAVAPTWSQTPVLIGDEFQVNTYTTHRQAMPSVTVQPGGTFVVVWHSNHMNQNPNDLAFDVRGQRFDAVGSPLGVELLVNTYTTSTQNHPEVSAAADGKFVVVWRSFGSAGTDTSEWSVQARRFDETGSALGADIQINTYTTSRQWNPSIAMKPDGGFVVVWESYGSVGTDTSYSSVQGQRFGASGVPIGGEFQINTYTTYMQSDPHVAIGANGSFVVVWQSYGSSETDTSTFSIQARRFDAVGEPIGAEFQVNTYTTYYQVYPRVAKTTDDGFVVAWSSHGSYGTDSDDGVSGQRFDEAGNRVGGEFQVNSYTTGDQGYFGVLSLTTIGEGGFVVVFSSDGSYGNDSSDLSVQGQRFAADTAPIGSQFQVNTYTTNAQGDGAYGGGVSVASGAGGEFVVAWKSFGSFGSDSDTWSIQGQRFATPIFTDGFETGDTSAWSSSQ